MFNRFYRLEIHSLVVGIYTPLLTRFVTYKIASPPQTKITSKGDIKGLATTSCPCTITPKSQLCPHYTRPTYGGQSTVEIKIEHSEWKVQMPLFSSQPHNYGYGTICPWSMCPWILCLGLRGNDVSHVSGLVSSKAWVIPCGPQGTQVTQVFASSFCD